MTEIEIADTTLVVTGVRYQRTQTSLLREERGEVVTLLAVRDRVTGATGHLLHEIATDKRDIEEENFFTDNPALFADQHPEAVTITELSCCGPEGTPGVVTEELTAVLRACYEHALEYREGDPAGADYEAQAWGLYLAD